MHGVMLVWFPNGFQSGEWKVNVGFEFLEILCVVASDDYYHFEFENMEIFKMKYSCSFNLVQE